MKKYTPDQIVGKLRQADVELSKGKTVKEVCRVIEVTEQTYYRWRQKYGGMSPELIKELKSVQKENQRLRKIIADQRIDMEILKEAIAFDSKNC
jgi:putative transposase